MRNCDIILTFSGIVTMAEIDIKAAMADIESTSDLLERAGLAALPSFGVLEELRKLRLEVGNG
jgi:hypothetical protein